MLRELRQMMVRGLYSGCGLEEACEVKVRGGRRRRARSEGGRQVWIYTCGGTYRGKEEASHMWTLVGSSESFRMPPADCEAGERRGGERRRR